MQCQSDNQTRNNINKTSFFPVCMQKHVNNHLFTLHFILSISAEFICHSLVIVCRFLSGERKQATVLNYTQITPTATKNKQETKVTQLFNNVLSQAGRSVCLMMTVWVLQAVWPAPQWCMHTCHCSWLAVSQAATVGGGGRGVRVGYGATGWR